MTDYKDKNFVKLTTPNTAYVTFAYEEAFLKTMESIEESTDGSSTKKLTYDGEELVIKRAYQPTNLLWENFEMTEKERRPRFICAIISLIIFGLAYFTMASYSNQLSRVLSYLKQPSTVNCDQMFDFYGYKQLETLTAMEFADSYMVT